MDLQDLQRPSSRKLACRSDTQVIQQTFSQSNLDSDSKQTGTIFDKRDRAGLLPHSW